MSIEQLAIVGPSTWSPFVPLFEKALRVYRIEATIRSYGFGDEVAVLAGNHIEFLDQAPRGAFILQDARILFRNWLRDPRRNGVPEADGTAAAVSLIGSLARLARRLPETTWVVATLAPPYPNTGDGVGDSTKNDPFTAATAAFNRELWTTAADRVLHVLDTTRLQREWGSRSLFDYRMDHLARFPGSANGMMLLAERMAALWAAITGRMKKVLVLDCDNTLWSGIVAEDGVDGIQLGDDGIGRTFSMFQESLLALEARGVLLTLCSRNNPQDVEEVFARRPEMVIPRERIAATSIGWGTKGSGIQELAQQLGLGLDSFVFIDDNPREREEVRQTLPMVTVAEFPTDIADLPTFASELGWRWFQRVRLADEDRNKTKQYRALSTTEQLRRQCGSPTEFLRSLRMEATISVNHPSFVFRLSQLTQKTNQFNLTLRRYTEAEVREMITSTSWHLFAASLVDRFGDHGIVAALFAQETQSDWRIDVLLVSCRVLGRSFEHTFVTAVMERLRRHKPLPIKAEFVQGARNGQMETFCRDLGFAVDSSCGPNRLVYLLAPTDLLHIPEDVVKVKWNVST